MQQVSPDGGTPPGPLEDEKSLEEFLYFGFLPRISPQDPLSILGGWEPPPDRSFYAAPLSEIVQEGVRAFSRAIEEQAAVGGSGDQVVFLSGGFDSRAILGGLLKHFDRSKIVAATFGQPGVKDFDIAQHVAATVGVRHVTLDTRDVEWTTEELVASVKARTWPMPFPTRQRYLSYHLHRKLGPDNVFWDGLCGDAVAGSRLQGPSINWEWDFSREEFVPWNAVPGGQSLVREEFQPLDALPVEPFWPNEWLSFPDQLNLAVRQTCRTRTRLMKDYETRTPFLSRSWLDFMLAAPTELRHGQQLYRQVLAEAFPRLLELPSTNTARSAQQPLLRRVLPKIARKVRRTALPRSVQSDRSRGGDVGANSSILRGIGTRADISAVVEDAVNSLAENGTIPWLDVQLLWKTHMSGEEDYRHELDVLTALDLNLKARPEPAGGGASPAGEPDRS